MSATPRFGLPFLLPGQAQKEHFHNEALSLIDAVLCAAAEEAIAMPPAQAELGQCWIVAAGASDAWNGRVGCLAAWTEGGWRFAEPVHGMAVWNKAAGYWTHWDGAEWSDGTLAVAAISVDGQQVLAGRQPAIASPSNGTIIDAEARTAIDRIIATLMSHGLID